MSRILITGTSSGAGKTAISAGIMAALSEKSVVQPYKVGPDFIDPMYHTAFTGRASRNLDGFMMQKDVIMHHFQNTSSDADISVIEGVRGLYEGLHPIDDTGSTAEIAKLLETPVILVLNARSLTRSAAAIIKGFKSFDTKINIAGVILNNVSNESHRDKLIQAITQLADTEVLGTVYRKKENHLPERHLGLNTLHDGDDLHLTKEVLSRMIEEVDVDKIKDIADSAPELEKCDTEIMPCSSDGNGLVAAIPQDRAYCFYYPENIECLKSHGVKITYYRPSEGDNLPDADIHYLGGGYPELYAQRISENEDFLSGLHNASHEGKLVYGECGGLMTLCESLQTLDKKIHPMAGIFPAEAQMNDNRQGLAYVEAFANNSNPIFKSSCLRAHEFHYSNLRLSGKASFGYDILRGSGILPGKDGITLRNTLGTYMHQHALSDPEWGKNIIDRALLL